MDKIMFEKTSVMTKITGGRGTCETSSFPGSFSEASVALSGEAGTNHPGDSYHLQNSL